MLPSYPGAAHAGVTPVAKDQERAWSNHVLPLPHEISIPIWLSRKRFSRFIYAHFYDRVRIFSICFFIALTAGAD